MVNYGTIVINYGTICMVEPTKLVINSTFRHLLGVAIILEFRANHRQLGKSWGDLGLNILGNIGHIYICIHIIIYISLSHAFTVPSFALVAPLCHLYRSSGSRTQKIQSPISHACFQSQFVSLAAPVCH